MDIGYPTNIQSRATVMLSPVGLEVVKREQKYTIYLLTSLAAYKKQKYF